MDHKIGSGARCAMIGYGSWATALALSLIHISRQMHEKTNPNIKTIRPLKAGVIADFNATELMLLSLIHILFMTGCI